VGARAGDGDFARQHPAIHPGGVPLAGRGLEIADPLAESGVTLLFGLDLRSQIPGVFAQPVSLDVRTHSTADKPVEADAAKDRQHYAAGCMEAKTFAPAPDRKRLGIVTSDAGENFQDHGTAYLCSGYG
jgi:hypothetical protein